MSDTLVDTNILLRRLEPGHPQHMTAIDAVDRLMTSGAVLSVAAQSIGEFWAVATRPRGIANGLGFDVAATAAAVTTIERAFAVLLSDETALYERWKRLLVEGRVSGRRVFDARLVAVMLSHGIERLLTFNGVDFAGLGIQVLDPAAVT